MANYKDDNSEAPQRFLPAGNETTKEILKKHDSFAEWAARQHYDVIILPFSAFLSAGRRIKELKQSAAEYGISLEAGGHELSNLVPRNYFFFHRDFFRMVEGRRVKTCHFCPTNPGTIALLGSEAGKYFRAAEDVKVFHLWPDKDAETVWCSCPTCRAFSPLEQNRIAVNTAADILAAINPNAFITYFEKPGDGGNIPLRANLLKMETLPEPVAEPRFSSGRERDQGNG
ncbi:MAG: DUF4838 domain-containing protein [Treponema sp.]|nr:DUF4838 domain-containing protein [Treponema sp.]